MFLEAPLSAIAWIGVILIQAIVHFAIMPRLRQRTEADDHVQVHGEDSESAFRREEDDDEEDDDELLEEDEQPENFVKLLSQTGDEVIDVSGKKEPECDFCHSSPCN